MPKPIAIVGGDSLLGNDVREFLAAEIPGRRVKLVGLDDEATAILTAEGDEPVVMTRLDADVLASAELAILAGTADASRKAARLVGEQGRSLPLIDLAAGLEDRPEARLRAPGVEAAAAPAELTVVAHPAAMMLAQLLGVLQRSAVVQRSVVNIFAPASELGRVGVNELQQQAVQLLSFQPLATDVFDAQLCFNLLAGRLGHLEQRIERHVTTLLGANPPASLPSIRVTQASVMHGLSMQAWVEMARPLPFATLLRDAGLDVWPDDAPNLVGIAGQDGPSFGAIETDRSNRRAAWIWAVGDNYRMLAKAAVALARERLG